MFMLAEQKYCRLDAPEKLVAIYFGFADGDRDEGTGVKRE